LRRADLVVALALLGLSGCMKIYPDPELPDIEVTWYEGDCDDETSTIEITATGIDDPTERHMTSIACTAMKTTFKDVTRQRFHVTGSLKDAMGGVYGASETDVDLRNGFDETAYLYFGVAFSNFRVAWTFDMGDTCASLGAEGVDILFSMNGQPEFAMGAPCDLGTFNGSSPPGTFSVSATAYNFDSGTVAYSMEPIPDVTIGFSGRADIGTIVLTACAPTCPDL
jgi:hypothetical protein